MLLTQEQKNATDTYPWQEITRAKQIGGRKHRKEIMATFQK